MAATPGLQEGGHEYYTLAGAERLRDALQDFDGGRVLVSVLGQPFKCPPAPFEGAFMLHEHFKQLAWPTRWRSRRRSRCSGRFPSPARSRRCSGTGSPRAASPSSPSTSSPALIPRHGRRRSRTARRSPTTCSSASRNTGRLIPAARAGPARARPGAPIALPAAAASGCCSRFGGGSAAMCVDARARHERQDRLDFRERDRVSLGHGAVQAPSWSRGRPKCRDRACSVSNIDACWP
jgi:hypothetical protein